MITASRNSKHDSGMQEYWLIGEKYASWNRLNLSFFYPFYLFYEHAGLEHTVVSTCISWSIIILNHKFEGNMSHVNSYV